MVQLESSLLQASFMPTLHSGSRPALSLLTVPKCTWTFNFHETFKCAQLVRGYAQASKQRNMHMDMCNAVSLVWSLLRLAPIMANSNLHVEDLKCRLYFL